MSLFNSQIPDWWSANVNNTFPIGGAALADRVWVANICQHKNASQIAAMPLEFHGTDEPAWVSSPDPNGYPNGIGDAMYAIVDQMYGWGWSLQYVTDFYADGFPRRWTVIPSASCEPRFDESGSRVYKLGDRLLDPGRVVQIDRNPTTGAHGTSALRAFAQQAWGLLAAQNQSMTVTQGGMPKFYLKSERNMTKDQSETFQEQWMERTAVRNGAPPVVPPHITPTEMSFNPSDLSLLENQEWNSRVIANAYGIPSVLLNMALQGGLTYQNPMALMQMWWLTELRTTAKRIVDAFTAQMLPSGQWVSVDASDITTELGPESSEDDPQSSQVAKASPIQQRPLTAIGGGAG